MDLGISPVSLLLLPVLLFSLMCHEVGHAWSADLGGDDTARLAGRISLNPLAHLDPMGTVFIVMMTLWGLPIIGWAKPVPVNPSRLRSPKWRVIVALSGVTINASLVVLALLTYRLLLTLGVLPGVARPSTSTVQGIVSIILRSFILINMALLIFNLIPIPPLDGSHVLFHFIKSRQSPLFALFQFLERFGFMILLLLVVTGAIGFILFPIQIVAFTVIWFLFGISPQQLMPPL